MHSFEPIKKFCIVSPEGALIERQVNLEEMRHHKGWPLSQSKDHCFLCDADDPHLVYNDRLTFPKHNSFPYTIQLQCGAFYILIILDCYVDYFGGLAFDHTASVNLDFLLFDSSLNLVERKSHYYSYSHEWASVRLGGPPPIWWEQGRYFAKRIFIRDNRLIIPRIRRRSMALTICEQPRRRKIFETRFENEKFISLKETHMHLENAEHFWANNGDTNFAFECFTLLHRHTTN